MATKRTLAFILALFAMITVLSGSLLAQTKVVWGVKGGISLSEFTKGNLEFEWDMRTVVVAGGFLTISLSEYITLQPELLYVQKGANGSWSGYEISFTGSRYFEWRWEDKLDYLELPVLAKVWIPAIAGILPNVYVGPALAIKLRANEKSESSFFDSTGALVEHSVKDKGIGDFIKDTDIGVTFGIDLQTRMKSVNVFFDARYTAGLGIINERRVSPESKVGTTEQWDTKNKVFSFMIGLGFPLK